MKFEEIGGVLVGVAPTTIEGKVNILVQLYRDKDEDDAVIVEVNDNLKHMDWDDYFRDMGHMHVNVLQVKCHVETDYYLLKIRG